MSDAMVSVGNKYLFIVGLSQRGCRDGERRDSDNALYRRCRSLEYVAVSAAQPKQVAMRRAYSRESAPAALGENDRGSSGQVGNMRGAFAPNTACAGRDRGFPHHPGNRKGLRWQRIIGCCRGE